MSNREEFLKSCLILDTETTSQDRNVAEIIESGFVIKENGSWNIFQELHKPKQEIPPAIESICYITNDMVKDAPPFTDGAREFQEVVNSFGYLLAHNTFYDKTVLTNHGIDSSKHTWLCTWRMVRKLFNGDETVELTNLPYLRFRFKLDVPIDMRCHRAGNDSFMTALLLEYMLDIMEERGIIDVDKPYGPQILEWVSQPIIFVLMPFGKHKNQRMDTIPTSYWMWALKNMDSLKEDSDDYDPDFAASINHAIDQQSNR
jgi:DNA polymerase III epsilon subunit-like protein